MRIGQLAMMPEPNDVDLWRLHDAVSGHGSVVSMRSRAIPLEVCPEDSKARAGEPVEDKVPPVPP